jgi:hypothetical protein
MDTHPCLKWDSNSLGSMFLRDADTILPDCTASHPKGQQYSRPYDIHTQLWGLLLYSKHGARWFLRDVDTILPDYTASNPKIQ